MLSQDMTCYMDWANDRGRSFVHMGLVATSCITRPVGRVRRMTSACNETDHLLTVIDGLLSMIPLFAMRNAAYTLLTLRRITVSIFLSFGFFKYYSMIGKM